MLGFSIIQEGDNSNEIVLFAKFSRTNQTDVLLKTSSFNFSLPFKIRKCALGYYIRNNICYQCEVNTFSLYPEPTNETICHPCPYNAECYEGKTIVPKQGFWNQNKMTLIFSLVKAQMLAISHAQKGILDLYVLNVLKIMGKN